MSTALLIIDVQQALCAGDQAAHDIDKVVQRINALSARARAVGVPVVLVQHEEPSGDFRLDSPGWQLAEGLAVAPEDLRLRKATPDSFLGTGLDEWLRAHGVTALVICGLQTDFCVDTSVRRALAEGYDVVLVADAHSTLDNAVLPAAQIIAHHNAIFTSMSSFPSRLAVLPAAEVRLGD
ncbi:cysteine hydrolase family protein [Pseudomonas panipatensis]|jgi:nicotinamidase-related amidase|uniref:Nicotinamidase-related amidase n=1 Tax=Pseudomonas panipatensis TaxID=428992 RepID=A0A1G8L4C8_9PSED|nr:cysteine hydrolase family protein [Pseudomonas panipatensis]SDI50563.1 Nicotinamidase-related amidase [Pseudomonas panipatensis]SMP72511.1 Nicotinamidase-related amidase [Pseudomonas panipatensis]